MARLYGRRWSKARANYLEQHPWCALCEALDRMERATVVDHKIPHRGDPVLFWDEANWQSLCETHHNSTKQAVEKGRTVVLHGPDGYPAVEVGPGGCRRLR
ncbi:MAG TPA: HNH endonuclease signature motif containing protein [Gammaproteobacteria bacterium]